MLNEINEMKLNDLFEINNMIRWDKNILDEENFSDRVNHFKEKQTILSFSILLNESIPTLYLNYLNASSDLSVQFIETILLLSRESCVLVMAARQYMQLMGFDDMHLKDDVYVFMKPFFLSAPSIDIFKMIISLKKILIQSLKHYFLSDDLFVNKMLSTDERHIKLLDHFLRIQYD